MENVILIKPSEFIQEQRQLIKEVFEETLKSVNFGTNKEEILQINDVCKLLSKSRQTIINWSERGLLKRHYIGDSVFYLRSEILASLQNKRESNK